MAAAEEEEMKRSQSFLYLSDQIDHVVASAAVDDHLVSLSLDGRDNDGGGDSGGGSGGGNFFK